MALIPCVIENGINTCYIDSLLVALFYKSSNIEDILEEDPKDPGSLYLQDLIKLKFVEPMRRHYIIGSDIVNMIRNYSVQNGWCNNEGDIFDQQDVSEFYNFLIDRCSANYIEFEKIKINDSMNDSNTTIEKLPFIPLHPNILEPENSVKNLLTTWIDNTLLEKNTESQYTCVYHLKECPSYIPICINRFTKNGEKIHTRVNIMKKIKLSGISDKIQENMKWRIHAIICYSGITSQNGHYYTILLTSDNRWLLFDDMMIPSFKQIDINDRTIGDRIMRECVMLFYTLENYTL